MSYNKKNPQILNKIKNQKNHTNLITYNKIENLKKFMKRPQFL